MKKNIDPHTVDYSSLHPTMVSDDKSRSEKAGQIVGLLKARYGNKLKTLRVLDTGSSGGQITRAIGQVVKNIVGIDPDKAAISHATRNYSVSGRVTFKVADALKIPFPDNSFDLVINNQVYQCVRDDELMMQEIHRVLKPGGQCLFGARNKLAIVEPQYHLPFIAWMPNSWQTPYVKLFKRGTVYLSNLRDYKELKKLCRQFVIDDYTIRIIRDPKTYGFVSYEKFRIMGKILPLDLLKVIIPNYLWFLTKPNQPSLSATSYITRRSR